MTSCNKPNLAISPTIVGEIIYTLQNALCKVYSRIGLNGPVSFFRNYINFADFSPSEE